MSRHSRSMPALMTGDEQAPYDALDESRQGWDETISSALAFSVPLDATDEIPAGGVTAGLVPSVIGCYATFVTRGA